MQKMQCRSITTEIDLFSNIRYEILKVSANVGNTQRDIFKGVRIREGFDRFGQACRPENRRLPSKPARQTFGWHLFFGKSASGQSPSHRRGIQTAHRRCQRQRPGAVRAADSVPKPENPLTSAPVRNFLRVCSVPRAG